MCGLANIILDPLYVRPVEPPRLAVRNTKRGRPKHFSGKAVEFCINYKIGLEKQYFS
jgi:hypothetical protein